jgi:hypothetical protein
MKGISGRNGQLLKKLYAPYFVVFVNNILEHCIDTNYNDQYFWLFFSLCDSPAVGQGLLIHEVSRSHRTTHHSRWDSSVRVIGNSQRPLPDNTQHSQQTNIHVRGRIRTRNLSRRAAVDPRLRPHGHWDRLYFSLLPKNMKINIRTFFHDSTAVVGLGLPYDVPR